MTSFTEFNLQPFIIDNLKKIGFLEPTAVQQRVIPLVTAGKNVVTRSFTGTGKTHAFLLPLVNAIDSSRNYVQAVITAPSRELATQIYQVLEQLVQNAPKLIKISNFVGGTDKNRQIKRLLHQQPQIVVGTPGRILDLVKSQALLIHQAQTFVVDEADLTLDLGFLPEVDQIASRFNQQVQMLVFSATIPEKLQPFLKKYLENPIIAEIDAPQIIAPQIENILMATKGRDPNQLIYRLLTRQEPYLALVFANTKERVNQLSQYLKDQGLKVATIHGDLPARERRRVMKQIQNLEYQYLIATDLAARGIDLEGVSLVINAEIPREIEFFIHRVGRTGRANLSGTAITLYQPEDEELISKLEKLGIVFSPKTLKNGELVAVNDRNRRQKRVKKKEDLDQELIGLVKKKKRKIKPAYRKKIKSAISESNKQKRKIAQRTKNRVKRKERKQKFNV